MREAWRGSARAALAALVAVLAAMAAPQSSAAAEALVPELGAEDEAGPWGGPDGKGCGNEIVAAAFRAAGQEARLVAMPYARAKRMTLEGRLAGCFSMAWSPEFADRIVFAERPLYTVTATLFTSTRGEKPPASYAELPSGFILGLVIDYEYPPAVLAAAARGAIVVRVPGERYLLQMLAAGRLDGAVLMLDPLKTAESAIGAAGARGQVESRLAIATQDSFVGFSLAHPAGRSMKAAFDRGYALIRASGEYEAILRRWKGRM